MLEKLGRGVKIAEAHREKRKHAGFLADLFKGRASFELLFPWPERDTEDLKREEAVVRELQQLLLGVNPELIDRTSTVPEGTIRELSQKGFFALKVPEELGGKGLGQASYNTIVSLAASYSSAIAILISADNTIGVKFPLLKYGTGPQKDRYLPQLTAWPSGFCFTERLVGSDPARMRTFAVRVKNEEGETAGYKITGEKWYTTNSIWGEGKPLAQYLAVVAKIVNSPEEVERSECFGIFIVPTRAPGVKIGSRNEFCGMHGIYNANPTFNEVFVTKDELLGKEGEGFRIALEALNTGRIAIAAGCLAAAKQAFLASRWWADKREQWGKKIGEHEAIGSGMLVPAACDILAMEAMTYYAALLTDQGQDARLAAAACKVFASERAWQIVDDMVQIFGGRGYETYRTLSLREETAPVERIFRDARPNRIFEGSTQVLSQWFLREGLDDFLKQGSVFFEKGHFTKKARAAARFAAEYLKLQLPHSLPETGAPALLKDHLKFVKRYTRKLAKTLITYAGRHRTKLLHKQLTLERFFWIAVELFAMVAISSYAMHLSKRYGEEPLEIADMFCRDARLRILQRFRDLKENTDIPRGTMTTQILKGDYRFLHHGIMPAIDYPISCPCSA